MGQLQKSRSSVFTGLGTVGRLYTPKPPSPPSSPVTASNHLHLSTPIYTHVRLSGMSCFGPSRISGSAAQLGMPSRDWIFLACLGLLCKDLTCVTVGGMGS